MHKFLDYILGTQNYPLYAAEWFFAAIGVFLSFRLHVRSRNPASSATPQQFSWKFLMLDNALRILTTVVLLFIFLRFPEYLLQIKLVADNEIIILIVAFAIGFSNDKLAQLLKNLNLFGISPIRKSIQNEINTGGPDNSDSAGAPVK